MCFSSKAQTSKTLAFASADERMPFGVRISFSDLRPERKRAAALWWGATEKAFRIVEWVAVLAVVETAKNKLHSRMLLVLSLLLAMLVIFSITSFCEQFYIFSSPEGKQKKLIFIFRATVYLLLFILVYLAVSEIVSHLVNFFMLLHT